MPVYGTMLTLTAAMRVTSAEVRLIEPFVRSNVMLIYGFAVQRNYRSSELNEEIFVIQTSIVDDEHAPEQYGKTRANVTISGWHLK